MVHLSASNDMKELIPKEVYNFDFAQGAKKLQAYKVWMFIFP